MAPTINYVQSTPLLLRVRVVLVAINSGVNVGTHWHFISDTIPLNYGQVALFLKRSHNA